MSEKAETLGSMLSALAPTGQAAEETLHAIVLGEADAIVIETRDGPRVYTLRDASEPYRQLVERMPGAAVVLDADHTVLYCNGGLARMLGRAGLAGMDLLDLVAPGQRSPARELLIAGAQNSSAAEMSLISGDGARTRVRAVAAPLTFDGQPCVAVVVTALDDIEALKISAAGWRESERRFQMALENSPIFVFEQDLDLRYSWIHNPRFGYGVEQIIGRTDAELFDPALAPGVIEIKRRVIATGEPARQEVALAAPGGPIEYYDLHVEPRRDAAGDILGVICAATEITERKRADDILRENKALMGLAAEAARMTFAEFDFRGGRLHLAENFAQVMGYTPSPTPGISDFPEIAALLASHVAPDDRELVQSAVRDFMAGKLGGPIAYRVIGDDGAERWIEGRWRAEALVDGRPTRGVAVALDITERKRGENLLIESQQRSQLATEATRVGIWEWNIKTNVIWWDRQMFAIYGVQPTRDGLVNYDIWAAAVLPEDLAEQNELLRQHAREGGIKRREFRLRRHDDREIRVIQAVETVRANRAGQVEWVVGTNLDVTESKRAEEALKESDERLRLALSGAKAAAWQWNVGVGELTWSPECYEMYGRDPERELARYELWRDCLHPDDLAATEDLIRDLIRRRASDYSTQHRILLPSGEIRWLASMGKLEYAADGTPLRMSGINLDITQQKRAEQQLMESETRFRAAQEASLDSFLIVEPVRDGIGRIVDLKVVYVNPMAAQYCRSTPERMQGRLLSETLSGAKLPGGLIEEHSRIIESGRTQEYVLDYDADGIKGHFRNLIVPFGRYAAATFRDITASVEQTNALAAAKAEAERANQAKSRFLAAASHDLRQPVQSLVLLLSVIERQVAGQVKTVETVKMMRAALDGLHGLLNSVLDISRLDAGVVAPVVEVVDLGAAVGKLAAEYELQATNMALELRCVTRQLLARTDPTLLERALRNLIENALRYTSRGGILLAVRRRGACARIDVIDTGIGIPEDRHAEIFEEFHQLNNPGRNLEQGLGLGLAIVGRLAELLGTKVEVSSRVGRGSRFSLSFPLYCDAAPAGVGRTAIDDPGGRVLIIEDNVIVRNGLEAVLQQYGYDAVVAVSGEEALDLAAKAGWRFGALVADYRLGEGLNGIETARLIHRRAGRAIPTLVVTGDTDRERIAEIEASGFAILHKPVEAEVLRRQLAQLIER